MGERLKSAASVKICRRLSSGDDDDLVRVVVDGEGVGTWPPPPTSSA
jgi:hypothetical protein